jgi:hypothetical protein
MSSKRSGDEPLLCIGSQVLLAAASGFWNVGIISNTFKYDAVQLTAAFSVVWNLCTTNK